MTTIAFLGAGLIAAGMVEAARSRAEDVTVWNRSLDKARALERFGARVAGSPAEAVAGAERVHIVLSDDVAVDAVLGQAAPAIGKDALVLDHTTVSPAGTAARAAWCEERGVALLHAPIFMSPAAARDATGLILCSGPRARFERAQPALARMTGEVVYVGERPELAAAYKLFGNAMLVTMIAGIADVFAVAVAQGVVPEDALGLFQKLNVAALFQRWGRRMAQGDFTPSGTLTIARKDVRLMLEAAGAEPLAVLPGIAARMDQLIAEGHGEEDIGALAADAIARARRGWG
jgi:3-hydroxyisobutyrate dehydrogenase-like beta-hydroxyacid dehydrogenase